MLDAMSNVEHIPGQMDVFECIEVAETGSDGKPPASELDHRTDRPRRSELIARAVRKKIAATP